MRGATALTLHFEIDSCTNSETLHLLAPPQPYALPILNPLKLNSTSSSSSSSAAAAQQVEAPAFVPVTGAEGKRLTFSGRNFPRLPLRIQGDSVTFVLERGPKQHHHHAEGTSGLARASKHAHSHSSTAHIMPVSASASASSGASSQSTTTGGVQPATMSLATLMPAMGLGMPPWRIRCAVQESLEPISANPITNWLLGVFSVIEIVPSLPLFPILF
jgi:hypothetical protein